MRGPIGMAAVEERGSNMGLRQARRFTVPHGRRWTTGEPQGEVIINDPNDGSSSPRHFAEGWLPIRGRFRVCAISAWIRDGLLNAHVMWAHSWSMRVVARTGDIHGYLR